MGGCSTAQEKRADSANLVFGLQNGVENNGHLRMTNRAREELCKNQHLNCGAGANSRESTFQVLETIQGVLARQELESILNENQDE